MNADLGMVRAAIDLILQGKDHRNIVVDSIDRTFVQQALSLFEQVVCAKLRGEAITSDWYENRFLDNNLDKEEIAWNGGINLKTVSNKRGSEKKEIVLEEAVKHHRRFRELVDSLTDDSMDLELTLTLNKVSVSLNLNETIVVVNALAVRRAGLRGGAWSSIGKQVEGPLMEVMCRAFEVPDKYFTRSVQDDGSLREVDFYLLPPGRSVKCEVKLMGKGNPESADAVVARESKVFVASTLSDLNKKQLDDRNVHWTELQTPFGFLRFEETLAYYCIPYQPIDPKAKVEAVIDRIEQALEMTFDPDKHIDD